nr:hypothetical protein [Desulfobacula sp.]
MSDIVSEGCPITNKQHKLKIAGLALYGPRWQTDLSRALNLSDARRIRQWMSGDRPIPPGIWPDLVDLLKIRLTEINVAIETLKGK